MKAPEYEIDNRSWTLSAIVDSFTPLQATLIEAIVNMEKMASDSVLHEQNNRFIRRDDLIQVKLNTNDKDKDGDVVTCHPEELLEAITTLLSYRIEVVDDINNTCEYTSFLVGVEYDTSGVISFTFSNDVWKMLCDLY